MIERLGSPDITIFYDMIQGMESDLGITASSRATPPPGPAWLTTPGAGYLTPDELAMLDVLFDAILPADHARQIPGAVEVGASDFVSQLLAMADVVYEEISAWRRLYHASLTALNDYARAKFGQPLRGLTPAQAHDVVKGLEDGSVEGLPRPSTRRRCSPRCGQPCRVDVAPGQQREGLHVEDEVVRGAARPARRHGR
jgi:hypothetical protein